MPTNLFQEEADVQPEPEWDGFYLRRSGGSPEDIQRTLDMLLQAKRPVIFIGHGVTLAEAGKELTDFAHALQIPVISSPNGMGCLDMTDIRPPGTGAWALPPIPHKEPVFGAKYIPGK